jgi:hypothetical protein
LCVRKTDISIVKVVKSKVKVPKHKNIEQKLLLLSDLTANLSLRAEFFVDERKAGEFVLIDAANDIVWNGCQHRFFAREFRVEVDGVACTSL